jgi:adenine-specific DNA-methyltransferase
MVKKGILNELLSTFDIASIEQHFIYSYLKNNQLDYTKSPLLVGYFRDFEQNSKLYFDVSSLNITTIKELENYLELIIPVEDRKFNGAFFTPDFVIDFIIREIKPKEDDTNLDPSCGCGAFLVGLTEYYKQTYNKPIRKIVKENIFGSDILEYNIHRAKLILAIFALQNGEILKESDFNFWHQDSLRTDWEMQFDNIVGNPPYVKFQDLTDENRSYLAKHWTTVEGGTFNLYFAFFELGHRLLNSTGKLGYITPNNYFTSLAGEALRKYFQNQKCVTRIIDFSHKKVFDAQTYTAITFLNKQSNNAILYDRIKQEQSPDVFLSNANGSPNYLKNLNIKKWRLLKTDEQKNIEIIEKIGTPIGTLFDICVGIATLKDEIYFIDSTTEKNGCYLKVNDHGTFEIEKEITKPVYKISDFKNQDDLKTNKRRIICPYIIKGTTATAIPESEFQKEYPKCYAYFLSEKENLLGRDKGKIIIEPFFAWGRTQGLTRRGKKILNPTFSLYPRFLLVEEEEGYFTNGYGIYFRAPDNNATMFSDDVHQLSKIENVDVVQKILNSIVMHYYVSKTSIAIEGGYPCYQKNFIEKFTVPEFTQAEIATLQQLTDKQEIDEFLIAKYNLSIYLPNLAL